MDPVTVAAIAATIGWLSIVVVVRAPAPRKSLDLAWVRGAGAAAIAAMAVAAFGLPMPVWAPIALFLAVLAVGYLRPAPAQAS